MGSMRFRHTLVLGLGFSSSVCCFVVITLYLNSTRKNQEYIDGMPGDAQKYFGLIVQTLRI